MPRLGKALGNPDNTPQSYVERAGFGGVLADAFRGVLEKAKEALDVETLDQNPPATSSSNETSVVQMRIFGDQRVLLTGDVGPEGLAEAADYAENMLLNIPPNLLQVPHHGSRRNVTPAALNRWLGEFPAQGTRGNAIASVGKDEGSKYPRKKVSNAFIRRGYRVYSTKDGWVNFRHDWDERPDMFTLDPCRSHLKSRIDEHPERLR